MAETKRMTADWEIRFGMDSYENSYYATAECPNCNNRDSLLVKQGVPLASLTIKCSRCKAAKMGVRP